MPDQLLTVLKFALLAVLYLFFLRVVRAVWAELKDPKPAIPVLAAAQPTFVAPPPAAGPLPPVHPQRPVDDPATGAHLVVVDPPDAGGRAFALGGERGAELTLGRSPGCGVALPDDTFVSQLHARVFRDDSGWQIEDLGSTNGTFLNRHKVSGPQSLRPGDRIQVGRTVLEVQS